MLRLRNPIRRYDWGSTTAIPQLLGTAPDGEPQAELWLGAHPDAPSTLPDGERLDDLIARQAETVLGPQVRTGFGDRLPYLAKVLAAAEPLSLQVHPDADQAAAGFAQEEAAAVPRDARERRYKDPLHKPEMVVALQPFDALCGWRSPAATRGLLAALAIDDPLWAQLDGLLAHDDDAAAIRQAVTWLLKGDVDVAPLVTALGDAAAAGEGAELATAAALAQAHPADPGVLVALLLNRVTLARGEALYLPAGNVHAYLHGTAVEVMAASDNVLRAGLTTKHVDAAELLRIVDFTPRPLPRVTPAVDGVWRRYRPGAAEFQLDWADLDDDGTWQPGPDGGPRVVLVLEGSVQVRTDAGEDTLATGGSTLALAADGPLHLRGRGVAVVVSVPPGVHRVTTATHQPTPLLGGVEAGGTKVVCALGTGPEDLRDRVAIPTGDPVATLDRIAAFFTDHADRGDAITALGVAAFGPLDLDPASPTFGSVTTTPKPGWAGTDLLGGLATRLQVPITLDTDVNGAAWGEHRWGATRGLASSAYVTVGTGIGGGAIVEGQRLHGLMHPEMGHLHVQRHPDDDFEGTCPFHGGCLEGLASGPAIRGRTGTPAQDLDPRARATAVRIEAWYLAQLVTAVMYLLSPQRVVLGGGVLHLDGLLDAVRDATTARLSGAISGSVVAGGMAAHLVRPQLGDDAGVLGALALALDALSPDAATPPTTRHR